MLKNPNRSPVPSSGSLDPEAVTSSPYSLDSDDRLKRGRDAGSADLGESFDPNIQNEKTPDKKDWEAYLNQRPDEYGKDPNGNLLPPKEDLYNQTLNEARRERESMSLTDLATAAGEALARGDKTMADDLQDEILQGLIDRTETYELGQEAIDQRIRQLTKIMDNAEKVAKEKAAKAASRRTVSFPATSQAPESAPATPATSESGGQSRPEGLGELSGEEGNDDEALDMTCLLRAEDYKKNMDSANWYSNAYKSASEDASPEKRSQLLMVSKWYNNRGTIYAGLRDTQLALANPSISSGVRQALIGKERTLINLLKDSENYKPKYDPSLDLAVYNNGEPNSQSEQNKNGGGEQPESNNTKADKEKRRRLKKFGRWLIDILAINEPTSSIDTTPKSSDGTGNTVDQEQRVKVKVSRKQPLNPIPKRQVRRKSSTNATN